VGKLTDGGNLPHTWVFDRLLGIDKELGEAPGEGAHAGAPGDGKAVEPAR
jgi:hypothetical protein